MIVSSEQITETGESMEIELTQSIPQASGFRFPALLVRSFCCFYGRTLVQRESYISGSAAVR